MQPFLIPPGIFQTAPAGPKRLFGAALLCAMLPSCSDGVQMQNLGEGDDVTSRSISLPAADGLGGAGGAGPNDEEPVTICFPEIITGDEGPECFVAEVSSGELDCSRPGRETLTSARRNAAIDEHCRTGGLSSDECDDVSACGITKLTGESRESCEEGQDGVGPGYCLAAQKPSSCPAFAVDALFVLGSEDAPLQVEAPDSLQIFCAVEYVAD